MSHIDNTPISLLPTVTRRAALGGLGAAVAIGKSTLSFGASSTSAPRLVVINVRGGMDGLATIIPYGDRALPGLRSSLVPATGMLKIDNFYAVSPAMPNFYAMVRASEALAVHAVGPTVYTRSHFQAQDYMQAGSNAALTSGWLSRALALTSSPTGGLAMSPEIPLILRGPTVMQGWAPEPYAQIPTSISSKLTSISAGDSVLGPTESTGFADRIVFNQILGNASTSTASNIGWLGTIAGKLLGASNGPRVAVLETNSFDTHENQVLRLPDLQGGLDKALLNLKISLGAAWAKTVVMTVTEFGRTAYVNGTGGTDHGTGFAVLLAGGAVAGGKVVARWPGLSGSQLYQGRDLLPTADFRSVAMGVLTAHMGIAGNSQNTIFPSSTGVAPMAGLIRS